MDNPELELLSACIALRDRLEQVRPAKRWPADNDALRTADAAIAKALGRGVPA